MGRHNNSHGGRSRSSGRNPFVQPSRSIENIARSLGFKEQPDGSYRRGEGSGERWSNPNIRQTAHVVARPIGRTASLGCLDAFDEIVWSADGIAQASKRRQTGILYLPKKQVAQGLEQYYGGGVMPRGAIQRWLDDNELDLRRSSLEPVTLQIGGIALHSRHAKNTFFLNAYAADVVDGAEPQIQAEQDMLFKALGITDEVPNRSSSRIRQYQIGWGSVVLESEEAGEALVAAAREVKPEVITFDPISIMLSEPDIRLR